MMRNAFIALFSFGLAWVVPQIRATANAPAASLNAGAESVQEFLELSAQQQSQLEQLAKTLRQKAGSSLLELEAKQKALRQQLANGDDDALAAGKALLELEVAKRKVEYKSEELRHEALALLTPGQRAKLSVLEQAQKLHPVARQASSLFLIAPPDAFLTGAGPLGMFPVRRPQQQPRGAGGES